MKVPQGYLHYAITSTPFTKEKHLFPVGISSHGAQRAWECSSITVKRKQMWNLVNIGHQRDR